MLEDDRAQQGIGGLVHGIEPNPRNLILATILSSVTGSL
jgi:hypothetical protein